MSPIGAASPVPRVETATSAPVRDQSFAAALGRRLEQPRAEIAQVRAQVSALRNGGALRGLAGTDGAALAGGTPASPASAGEIAALFERQIQQESGFAPEVVTGQRRSSAGAEGIAQSMPQCYPHVNRTDLAQSLCAGAQSMQQYLSTWNGDVRRALASYNAGLGRVQSAVAARGAGWEAALPQETSDYLVAIVGGTRPVFSGAPASAAAWSGGRAAALSAQQSLAGSLRALGGFAAPTP
ncbi:MAG: hypothetical protein EXR68_07250 [Dehalococcoidia bacterium]|nr:hypothetical protein [Dehalococcoidia bacterium]